MAVARIWKGATRSCDGSRYLQYLEQTGLSEYARTPGNLGSLALWREQDGRTEFFLISLWDSMDAVRAFAGSDATRAVFYPEDERYLVEADQTVGHFGIASWHRAEATARAEPARRGWLGRLWVWLSGRDPLRDRESGAFTWQIAGVK